MNNSSANGPGTLTPRELVTRRFFRHRLAVGSLLALGVLYIIALFAEFVAPHSPHRKDVDAAFAPPQPIKFSWEQGFYTHPIIGLEHPVTRQRYYMLDREKAMPLRLFVKGDAYRLWGLLPCQTHLFGIPADAATSSPGDARFYLLGADGFGRDLFSRIVFGARISLSVGLVAIVISALLGIVVGGISGYLGGAVDNVIQRLIEVINSFPQIPLWLAFAAVFPPDWSPLKVYFAITVVLSLFGWTGLARVVRGKILSLREEEYAMAARLLGANHGRVLFRHLVPGFTSHIIVSLTLTVPGMILGETALSFLGLGLRPPVVSWGVMIQDTIQLQVIASYPWLLMPVFLVIITVLAFNFLGDGLRDAADPYA